MSKLPFHFDPIPKYFREAGLFDNPHTVLFVTWAFFRCQNKPHKLEICGKEITLAPYEFIAGRYTSPKECFLSENIFRKQLIMLEKKGLLKKTANSVKNKFTCYRWATEILGTHVKSQTTNNQDTYKNSSQNNPLNNRQNTDRITHCFPPENISKRQKRENENRQNNPQKTDRITTNKEGNKRNKESHQSPLPPSSFSTNEKGLTDLSFKTQESKPTDLTFEANETDGVQNLQHSDNQPPFLKHNIYYQDHQTKQTANNLKDRELSDTKNNLNSNYPPSSSKNEVYPGVFLTQVELDECIAIKGSSEKVKQAVEYIMRSRGRKCKIYNWPNAMRTWDIKCDIKPRIEENREMGKRLQDLYQSPLSWSCEVYRDQKKDQDGVLFANRSPAGRGDSIFIAFIDPEFKEKATKIIREKKMQKALIPNS